MHFDLAHALVTVAVILVTLAVLEKTGVIEHGENRRLNWKAVVAMAVVVFILNLIWPYGA
jgi:uncharacterized membrane protein YGL010W